MITNIYYSCTRNNHKTAPPMYHQTAPPMDHQTAPPMYHHCQSPGLCLVIVIRKAVLIVFKCIRNCKGSSSTQSTSSTSTKAPQTECEDKGEGGHPVHKTYTRDVVFTITGDSQNEASNDKMIYRNSIRHLSIQHSDFNKDMQLSLV